MAQATPESTLLTHKGKLELGWKRVATLLSPEEHMAFKLKAVASGEDMSDIIRTLVLSYLKSDSQEQVRTK